MEYKKVSAKVFLDVIGDGREIPYWSRNVWHVCSDLYHIPVQPLIGSRNRKSAVVRVYMTEYGAIQALDDSSPALWNRWVATG